MEKLKDIFHDFSDIFTAIIIALLMLGVVAWNLGDWFDNYAIPPVTNNTSHERGQGKQESKIPEPPVKSGESISSQEEIGTPHTENEEKNEEKTNIGDNTSVEEIVEVTKEITIPNGAPGIRIAKILLENNLIDNTQDFIDTAETLGLSLKLKPGAFDIPTNADIETIVKIIAGIN